MSTPSAIATIIGGVSAAMVIVGTIRGVFERTIARRWSLYRRLQRLGCGAQLDFFTTVLREPPAMKRTAEATVRDFTGETEKLVLKSFTECFFVMPEMYVQTISDEDGSVLAYTVNSRKRWFRPTFYAPRRIRFRERIRGLIRWRRWWQPNMRVKLNKTKFAEALEERPEPDDFSVRVQAWIGARSFVYSEPHYFGNPGYYQTFVLTHNDLAPVGRLRHEELAALINASQTDQFDDGTASQTPEARSFRRHTPVTAFTVLGPHLDVDDYHWKFGPHGDEVRMLG